jgi:Tol biopolymer transport system component/DNA-binding winged helix-turn-helix (wHTH) protein
MSDKKDQNYRFDGFELDVARRRLLCGGEPVALKPKAFDLLLVLVENNGRLLTKEELLEMVWPGQIVEETNLSVNISAIRRALRESASEPRFITNVSGRGYYFTADLDAPGEELVVESRSFSRIVVEETDEAETRTLVAARRWIFGGAVGAAFAVLLVAVTYFVSTRAGSAQTEPSEPLSVNRLTATGRTSAAAISPDGKVYAFSQVEPDGRSSLWLSQIDGSGQLQLRPPTDKPLVKTFFSPDGTRIYYLQFEPNVFTTGTLYRVPLIGGVPEKVRDDIPARVGISPSGEELAFVRSAGVGEASSLIVARLDGSSERVLASRPAGTGRFAVGVDWSPDGRSIAVGGYTTTKEPGPVELFTVEVASGAVRQLTNENWYSIRSFTWASDGESVLAAAGDKSSDMEQQIVSVPVGRGGEVRRLLSDSNAYSSLDVSAGGAIVAVQGQAISNVWVAPADDLAEAKQVTFDMLGKQSGWNSIDWLPDGGIIYSGRVGKNDSIWQMSADGSGQHQLIAANGRNQYCSTPDDGSFIVFTSNRTGETEIWRSDREGADLRQLTFTGDNESPHVSPDGRWVVYNTGRDSERRLWMIPAEGGTPVRLTNAPSDWARFSPDSKRLAAAYEVDGKSKLAVLDIGGGEPVSVFDVPASANFRLSVRWTPDGRAVTYRDWQNGIWKQPLDGGPPVRLPGLPAEKLFAYAWSRDGRWFAYSRGKSISDAVLLTSLK